MENRNLKITNKKLSRFKSRQQDSQQELILKFSPTAWAKLLYFRDKSDNEIGGFGITEPDDLLFVKQFVTVKQEVTSVSIKFDDNAVADYFEEQVDLGRKPEQFGRTWIHTHPSDFAEPSLTDEETFERVFGNCQWAVMFILAQDDCAYARLRFNVGPGGEVLIPAQVDYTRDFGPSERLSWHEEYKANIVVKSLCTGFKQKTPQAEEQAIEDYAFSREFLDEFEVMEPDERQFVLDELAARPELWDKESGVMF